MFPENCLEGQRFSVLVFVTIDVLRGSKDLKQKNFSVLMIASNLPLGNVKFVMVGASGSCIINLSLESEILQADDNCKVLLCGERRR